MCNWQQGYVALGSSLGNRVYYLKMAILQLHSHPQIEVLQCSQVWATQPIGAAQNIFFNMVIRIETTLKPLDMLNELLAIELKNGRVRGVHWMDRTLDLDLLDLNGLRWNDAQLQLPHPRMWERSFVMVPLLEVYTDSKEHWPQHIQEDNTGMWSVGLFSIAKDGQIKYFAKKHLHWSSL